MIAALSACSVPSSTSGAGSGSPAAGPPAQASFEQLRSRKLTLPHLAANAQCPVSREAVGAPSHGKGVSPFFFGPWGFPDYVGDDKTPWTVESAYKGRLVVRGSRVGSADRVAFGFWPTGYGTPAEQPGVPIMFTRPDRDGRMIVYQPELDIEAPAEVDRMANSGHIP